jgi:oxygen-independent coproporphyrinogen-3 oxidase
MNLLDKYNVQIPRYTSYPTVPAWHSNPTEELWKERVKTTFRKTNKSNGISLYIHLPYCESLCTYCACNTRITVNHKVEIPYINSVLAEWKLYIDLFEEKPVIKEIHLGGGTPTFFSPANLKILIEGITGPCELSKEKDFSFEGHPGNTTKEHLQTLFDLGFTRVSFGIQDFDEKVQDTINRYQTFEEVQTVVKLARIIGYKSVNFDLVYGLPFQTAETISDTLEKVIALRPDRIAFYSYAHVPWMRPGQRKFTEKDLPLAAVKRNLYDIGLSLFKSAGYLDIGMDHFALPEDALYAAMSNKSMHRNFMGYTDKYTELLVALGASAISDCGTAFLQNIKAVEEYQRVIAEGSLPAMKGHLLTAEDQMLRKHILAIMCAGETDLNKDLPDYPVLNYILEKCRQLEADGLITIKDNQISVTLTGKAFLRNICACFDMYLQKPEENAKQYSTVA